MHRPHTHHKHTYIHYNTHCTNTHTQLTPQHTSHNKHTSQHTHTTHTQIYKSVRIYTHLPYSTCMVVFAVSNPMILSPLQLKTSPLLASVIVIVETFPLVRSGDPLRNHLIVIGCDPSRSLQSIVTSNPL